jgi:hypothetical protein
LANVEGGVGGIVDFVEMELALTGSTAGVVGEEEDCCIGSALARKGS